MNLHIILGLVGSGLPYISEKLQNVIKEKTNNSENLVEIKFGGFSVWDETKKYNYEGWNKRLKKFAHNNPHVQDAILLGPGAVINAKRFIEDYDSVTLYFLEKHQDIPWDVMIENFYENNKTNLGGNKDNWMTFINQVTTVYGELKSLYNPQLEAFLNFNLSEDQSILVESASSANDRLQKFLGIVRVK